MVCNKMARNKRLRMCHKSRAQTRLIPHRYVNRPKYEHFYAPESLNTPTSDDSRGAWIDYEADCAQNTQLREDELTGE